VLRALEELSVEEAAVALGIPEATVRSRFFRARGLLREALSKEIDLAYGDAFASPERAATASSPVCWRNSKKAENPNRTTHRRKP